LQESGFLTAKAGIKIYWQGLMPEDKPKALIFIAHGLGEHIGRYRDLAEYLKSKGFAVFGIDHRGHGKSQGRRGHILSFDQYLGDYKAFRDSVIGRFPSQKSFLLGHSLGGLISVHYVLKYPKDFSGLVLSSPALKIKIDANPITQALGRVFSRLLPGISISNGLDPNMLSHNPEVVKDYLNDPLVHDRVSVRWFTCFTNAIEEAQAKAKEIKIPILVMQSSEDRLVEPAGSKEFFEKVLSSDKAFKNWEGFYHEMFNELDKARVYQFFENWLEKHIA